MFLCGDETCLAPVEDAADGVCGVGEVGRPSFAPGPHLKMWQILDLIEQLPFYETIMSLHNRGFSLNILFASSIATLHEIRLLLQDQSEDCQMSFATLRHDLNNFITPLFAFFDLVNLYIEMGDSAKVGEYLIKNADLYEVAKLRSVDILNANISISTGEYKFSNASLRDVLMQAARPIVNSGYALREGKFRDISKGVVTVDANPIIKARVDVPALMVAVFNLLKNSVRVAGEEKIGILVRARLTSYDCVTIEVMDTGAGVDFVKIGRIEVEAARVAELDEQKLTPFQAKLLNGSANMEDLATRLMEFGKSFSGSSGVGLATVRTIVDGHGGAISLANREEGGLCVKILLPDSESDLPADRIRQVHNAQVAEELSF